MVCCTVKAASKFSVSKGQIGGFCLEASYLVQPAARVSCQAVESPSLREDASAGGNRQAEVGGTRRNADEGGVGRPVTGSQVGCRRDVSTTNRRTQYTHRS